MFPVFKGNCIPLGTRKGGDVWPKIIGTLHWA